MIKTCEYCNVDFGKPPKRAVRQFEQQRYCSRRCRGYAENPRKLDGFKARYRKIKTSDGRNMLEHRYVMEQHVGRRLLPTEQVHHVNRDRLDNRIENLELVTTSEHGERHTWRPVTTVCAICGTEFTPHKTKRGITKTCGQQCGAKLAWQTRRGAV